MRSRHDLPRTAETGWVILVCLLVSLVLGSAVFFPDGIRTRLDPEVPGAGRWTPATPAPSRHARTQAAHDRRLIVR